jgi:hypothetical protein
VLEITLNLLWVAIGLAALGALAAAEVCRPEGRAGYCSRRLLSVLLAVVFLFPCVSSSDDLLTLEDFQVSVHNDLNAGEPDRTTQDGAIARHLERLFENLQTLQLAAREPLPRVDRVFAMPLRASRTAPERLFTSTAGRDPPAPAFS